MSRPDTPTDPWEQLMWVFDHTDVQLVSDALKIVNSDDAEWMKIGKLQLLISDWEEKNLPEAKPKVSKLKEVPKQDKS